jgi:hypothetical protein
MWSSNLAMYMLLQVKWNIDEKRRKTESLAAYFYKILWAKLVPHTTFTNSSQNGNQKHIERD